MALSNLSNWSYAILGFFFMVLVGCNDFDSLGSNKDNDKSKNWIYVELVVETSADTTSFYRYGTIKSRILKKIESDENAKGLFSLSNTRYLSLEDKLMLIEDDEDTDTYFFKIEQVKYIQILKGDPIFTFEESSLSEDCLEFKLSKQKKK
ncbi:MAG: hypothetical protein COA58_07420 [Bacteroidetes bacterium]|nr:MAG: hypothetical protein COA58_07420 [Bacteroidota bacterium]